MGSFCSSKPATSTTNQTQSYSANPQIQQAGTQALNQAQGAASSPFQMPAAPVAGFNPFQTQAFGQYQGLQGGTNPFFQNATTEQTAGQTPVSQSDISANMNPFAQGALADLQKYIFDPQRRNTMGSAVQSAGGVGADRLALTSQNLDKTQGDALTQAESGFYGQAYAQAAAAKQQALQSAQGWANLGVGQQGAQLQATGALAGAGAQQQALTQAQLMSPYQQQLAQIAYPFQTAQFLAGITGGLAPAFGGTTSGQGSSTSMPIQPSPFSQIFGAGAAGLGIAGSLGAFGGGSGSSPTLYGGGVDSGGNNGQPVFAYADGGSIDEPGDIVPGAGQNPWSGIIPQENLQMGSGQNTGAHLNLSPPQAQQSSGSGSGGMDIGKIAQMAMMFMERGGSVTPYDMGRGFAPGGTADDDYENSGNPFDSVTSTGIPNFSDLPRIAGDYYSRKLADWMPSNQDAIQPLPDSITRWAEPLSGSGPVNRFAQSIGVPQILGPSAANAAPAASAPSMQAPQPFPFQVPPNAGTMPIPGAQLGQMPPPSTPPANPMPAPSRPGGGGAPQSRMPNQDLKVEDFVMPKSQEPYPDALSRDWGQTATRSPWMALVNAGAKMMQSTKSGIGGLGEGIEAGSATLDKQRTELRSEQQINQKADELYRHAKSELNKYTRKTPHELATESYREKALDQGKFGFVNYTDPATNQIKVARTDTKHGTITDAATGQPVSAGHIVAKSGVSNQASAIAEVTKQHPDWGMDKVLAYIKNPNFAGGQAIRIYSQDPRSMSQDAAVRNQAWVESHAMAGATLPNQGILPPSQGAIQALKSNPEMRSAFDAKYGAGSAAKVLGE